MYKIGIMGNANVGKNTLGKMLVRQLREYHGTKYESAYYLAFADPMKEMIRHMYPATPRKFLYGSSRFRNEIVPGAFKNGVPLTVRQLLIDIGTLGRSYNPNIWIDNFNQRFTSTDEKSIVVVPDMRFRNELDYLRGKGFYLIRLYRDTGQSKIEHISETGQAAILDEEFDYVLFNNNPIKDLKFEVYNRIIPHLYDK
jgi:hypothetical protein